MNEQEQVKKHFETGKALREQGKYQAACAEFQLAAENAPVRAELLVEWGQALSGLGNFPEAIEKYKKVWELDTTRGDVSFLWGNALFKLGSIAEATEKYRQAAELMPKHASAHFNWGFALAAQHKHDEAIEHYEKALELDPGYLDAHNAWGGALYSQEKYDEAIKQYQNALEKQPSYARAHVDWGLALAAQQWFEQAIEHYEKALELDPGYFDAHNAWGVALYSQQKYDEAIKQYQKALEKQPNYAPAHSNWGLALYAQQIYDEAIEHYKKALALDPKNPSPFLGWGNALNNQGRRAEAIEVCEWATEINEDFAYAYHNIACYLWAQGDYKAGRKAWERACEVYERTKQAETKKHNANFFQYYGSVLHEHFGKLEESEQVLQLGLDIDPHSTSILTELLGLYLDRHDEPPSGAEADIKRPSTYGKAREYFRKAEQILKGRLKLYEDSCTLQELGDLYLKMEEYDEAKVYLEKALKQNIESSAPYVSLGVLHSRKDDFRQAAWYFEAARRRDSNDLNIWSNMAEVHLKLNPKEMKQIEKAEAEFRKILTIAPDHIDSRIGLGEVYAAMAEVGEKDCYEVAITQYGQAIQLAENKQGSKRLKTREFAALRYSRGYARVKLYEASRPFGDESLLSKALQDFQACADLDPDHCKAEVAKDKLDKRLSKFSRRWFTERLAPPLVLVPSLFVFTITQGTFFFGFPQLQAPIGEASYISLTFGSIVFVVVGLFLPEIQKLKGAGIELEKGAVTQISTSGPLGISK